MMSTQVNQREGKTFPAGVARWTRSIVAGVAVTFALPLLTSITEPLLGPGLSATAEAQQTRRTPAIRANVFERLEEAQQLSEEEKYREAIRVLDRLRDDTRSPLNSYELANLYNLYAFIYFTQEDYRRALEAYRNVIKQPDIPEAMEVNTRYTVAQLLFVMDNWREGIEELRLWFGMKEKAGEDPGATAHALLAQAYYQLDDHRNALRHIEIAIDDFRSRGRVPREQWYGLQRFLYFERNDVRKVVEILEEMLQYYQKKEYWTQLAAMYNELNRDKDMLAAMETAYRQGMLTDEKELVNLAYMMLSQEVPYKAARVLDKGIKEGKIEPTSRNLELLGNAWHTAREVQRAIPEMEKAAAKADTGELWSRLSNIYLDNEEFGKAANAARSALRKGNLRRPEQAHMVLGMAEFNLKNYDNARKAFADAKKIDGAKAHAEQWLNFMENEIAREDALRRDMI